jgi:nitroreductase
MNLYEKVDKRVSVRSYSEEMPPIELIESCLKVKPLNADVELNIKVLEKAKVYPILRGLIGNYGKVEAPFYIVVQGKDNDDARYEAGFRLEQAILELLTKGIGTCWIGGILNKKEMDKLCEGPEGFTTIVVIALGFPAVGKKHIFTLLTKGFGEKSPRKSLEQIGVNKGKISDYMSRIVEAGRQAPSGINKQPWYFKVSEDRIDVFLSSSLFNKVDGGIVLSHLFLAALEEGFEARIVENKENPPVNGLLPFKSLILGVRGQ